MKRLLFIILATLSLHQAFAQDTIWVKYDNRFKANKSFSIGTADSIEFRMQERDGSIPIMKIYRSNVSRQCQQMEFQAFDGKRTFRRILGKRIWG